MNFGTKLRSVLVVATCLNTALMATDLSGFANAYVDFVYKVVSVVLNFVIVFCATYFNNDYTGTAREYTGMMRHAKEAEADDYSGETYERGDIDE